MTIRKIVAAVDASEPSRRAAERAVRLADRCEAELTLVHAYDSGPAEAATIVGANILIEQNRRLGEDAMKGLIADLGGPEFRAMSRLGSDVSGTIREAAHELDADLVVLGTSGRTGVSRFFLGSVAEDVMRRAHCSVWVERGSEPIRREVERITVCTDLSPLSEVSLPHAAHLASKLGSAVEVVHALQTPYRGLSIDARRELTARLRQRLTVLATKHFEGSVPRVSVVEGANVVDGITAHASRTSADLLVLASHGRTGLSRALMGSVAERVTRFAPCSVFVARSPVERSTGSTDGR